MWTHAPHHRSGVAHRATCTANKRQASVIRSPPPAQAVERVVDDESRLSRRAALLAAGTTASGLLAAPISRATTTVEVDGQPTEAYAFQVPLRVVTLRGSVPSSWVSEFKSTVPVNVSLAVEQRGQLGDIFEGLKDRRTKKAVGTADACTLGDVFLGAAIQRGLIQPIGPYIDPRWWDTLSPEWERLVRRDAQGMSDPKGQVWGVPYRWGCTLIAYRKDKVEKWGGQPVGDWPDLMQPRLQGKVGFVDAPREFIGAALKTLGLPYNTRASDLKSLGLKEDDVREAALKLRKQVRLFNNRDHVRALASGDCWAVVGWSSDLLQLASRSSNIVCCAPSSGTSLWADLWTIPAGAQHVGGPTPGPSPALPLWLEWGLQPERAKQLRGLGPYGAHPLLLPPPAGGPAVPSWAADAALPQDGGQTAASSGWFSSANSYMPPRSVLEASEFLRPLDKETLDMYLRIMASR